MNVEGPDPVISFHGHCFRDHGQWEAFDLRQRTQANQWFLEPFSFTTFELSWLFGLGLSERLGLILAATKFREVGERIAV